MPAAPLAYTPSAEQSGNSSQIPASASDSGDSLALLTGRMRILRDLDDTLSQGLFAWPEIYPAVVRLSAGPVMAIKLLDVEGPRLSEADAADTQDFILPAASGQGHPLSRTYVGAPILYGRYMGRLSIVPVSAGLAAIAADGSSDTVALRRRMLDYFARQGAEWEVRVKLCSDLDAMPVDGSGDWPGIVPEYPVAHIMVEPQLAWSEERSGVIDDNMVFSPWTGLAAHRPLGASMQTRRARDEAMRKVRSEKLGRTIREPRSFDYLFADEPARAEVFYP